MSTDTLTAPPEDAPEVKDEAAGEESAAPAVTDTADAAVKSEAESTEPAGGAAWGSGFTSLGSTPESAASTSEAVGSTPEAQDSASTSQPSKMAVILTLPLRLVIALLVLIDLPFAFLGARGKRFIGAVAVVTSIVAVTTWVGGSHISAAAAAYAKRHPAPPAEPVKPAGTSGHGSKAPAKAAESSGHGGKAPAKAPAGGH